MYNKKKLLLRGMLMHKNYQDTDIEILSKIIQKIFHVSIEVSLKEQRAYEYIDKYMYILKPDYKAFRNTLHRKDVTRNTIWICWLQGIDAAPKLVKRCIESIRENVGEHKIIILTEQNYKDYIKLPREIEEKKISGVISNTFFSDILRLSLLAEYGGTWIDATIYCTGKIPSYMLDNELFCFQSSIHFKSLIKGSVWWISANQNNDLICKARDVLYEYWKHESTVINYYILHLIISKLVDNDSRCRSIWYTMPYVDNSNSHILMGKMRQPYDDKKFQIICENSVIHKLSYKLGTGGRGSFYSKLISKRDK